MTAMSAPIKLFLSYAREDSDAVSQLYHRLASDGFEPWMDRYNITAGEQWELAIYRGIRRADFFLACLSAKSSGKRGMLQKELKEALEIWREKLDDDIYIIPVQLTECEVPQQLKRFQWVNLSEPDGFSRLSTAIARGAARQRMDAERLTAERAGITLRLEQLRDTDPKYDVNIEYPQFDGPPDLGLDEINTQIRALVNNEAELCRASIFASPLEIAGETVIPSSFIDGECQVSLVNGLLVSIVFDFVAYSHPAAHPAKWRSACNFSLKPVVVLGLDQLFDPETDYGAYLLPRIRTGLDGLGSWVDDIHLFDSQLGGTFYTRGQGAVHVSSGSIIFSFVGPYAVGVVPVEVPFGELREVVNPHGPLAALVASSVNSVDSAGP